VLVHVEDNPHIEEADQGILVMKIAGHVLRMKIASVEHYVEKKKIAGVDCNHYHMVGVEVAGVDCNHHHMVEVEEALKRILVDHEEGPIAVVQEVGNLGCNHQVGP
jgi:hypothetical protein